MIADSPTSTGSDADSHILGRPAAQVGDRGTDGKSLGGGGVAKQVDARSQPGFGVEAPDLPDEARRLGDQGRSGFGMGTEVTRRNPKPVGDSKQYRRHAHASRRSAARSVEVGWDVTLVSIRRATFILSIRAWHGPRSVHPRQAASAEVPRCISVASHMGFSFQDRDGPEWPVPEFDQAARTAPRPSCDRSSGWLMVSQVSAILPSSIR